MHIVSLTLLLFVLRPTQEVGGETQGGREDHSANSQAALLNGNNAPENHERGTLDIHFMFI